MCSKLVCALKVSMDIKDSIRPTSKRSILSNARQAHQNKTSPNEFIAPQIAMNRNYIQECVKIKMKMRHPEITFPEQMKFGRQFWKMCPRK